MQFAGGGNGAVDGGQEQVLPDREALVAFGRKDGIEQGDQIQALSDVEESGGIPKSGDLRFEGLRGLVGEFGGGDEIVDFAEVDLADDLGLAIDALAIASVVIGVAADYLGGEARHT